MNLLRAEQFLLQYPNLNGEGGGLTVGHARRQAGLDTPGHVRNHLEGLTS